MHCCSHMIHLRVSILVSWRVSCMWLMSTPNTGRRWKVGVVDTSLGGGDTVSILAAGSGGLVGLDLGLTRSSFGLLVLEPEGLFLESGCATVVRAVCFGDICRVSLVIMAWEVGGWGGVTFCGRSSAGVLRPFTSSSVAVFSSSLACSSFLSWSFTSKATLFMSG